MWKCLKCSEDGTPLRGEATSGDNGVAAPEDGEDADADSPAGGPAAEPAAKGVTDAAEEDSGAAADPAEGDEPWDVPSEGTTSAADGAPPGVAS